MEASFVVPGPLDVAGTLSRQPLLLSPGTAFDAAGRGVRPDLRRMELTTMKAEAVSPAQ